MTCARVVFILLVWLNAFGMAGAKTLRADLNGDCRVDMADLIILLQEWMQEGGL